MCVGCGSLVALCHEPRPQSIASRVAAESPSPRLLSTRDRGETTPHRSREGKILSLDAESLMCVRRVLHHSRNLANSSAGKVLLNDQSAIGVSRPWHNSVTHASVGRQVNSCVPR